MRLLFKKPESGAVVGTASKRRFPRGSRGGILIETALALPLLISLMLGLVEFGYYYHVNNVIGGAARNGARAGIPWNSKLSDITTAVAEVMTASGLNPSTTYTVVVADSNGTTVTDVTAIPSGSDFKVSVTVQWGVAGSGYQTLGLIDSNRAVTASCTMRKEF